MKTFNIYESFNEYSNKECFAIISCLIKSREYDTFQKILLISQIMSNITNDDLLNPTLKLLRECGWFNSEAQIEPVLKYVSFDPNYDKKDIEKFRAIIYSVALTYEVYMKQWGGVFRGDRPELSIFVKNRFISHNLESIYDNIRVSITGFVIKEFIEPLTPDKQKVEFCKIINSWADLDYNNSTNYFTDDIRYLEIKKNNIIPAKVEILNDIKSSNPYPRIFKSEVGFMLFERYKATVKNVLADYSFIYRKMLKDELIFENIGDKEFRDWLSSAHHIEIDKTKQLYLCSTPKKEHLYSMLKDLIKSE